MFLTLVGCSSKETVEETNEINNYEEIVEETIATEGNDEAVDYPDENYEDESYYYYDDYTD